MEWALTLSQHSYRFLNVLVALQLEFALPSTPLPKKKLTIGVRHLSALPVWPDVLDDLTELPTLLRGVLRHAETVRAQTAVVTELGVGVGARAAAFRVQRFGVVAPPPGDGHT